jgi:hypothetical protein
VSPGRTASDNGIDEDKELSGAGDEGLFVGFSFCDQSAIERYQLGIPLEGGRQGSGVEAGS